MPRKPRILVLSVSAGAGHVRAAEALKACGELENPLAEIAHLDVMTVVSTTFRKIYADLYIRIVSRHPRLWGMLYQATDAAEPDDTSQRLRRAVERLSTRRLRAAIAAFAPDSIICTHFLPAELMMREIDQGRLQVPVWVQVTDYDLHRMWVVPRMTGFFVGNGEVAFRLRAHGIDAGKIHVTGIPVMPAFGERHDRAACAARFGLAADRRTCMLMGGGAGLGVAALARRLIAAAPDQQFVVLAGRNAAALAELEALAGKEAAGRLFPLGFTSQVAELMAASDLVITKPGGLSTSECLAMGVPMIVTAPIPGQEERNADYLLEHGAALKATDNLALEYRMSEIQSDPTLLERMRERARALGRPDAGRAAMRIVLGALA